MCFFAIQLLLTLSIIIIDLDACIVGNDLGVPVEDCVILLAH